MMSYPNAKRSVFIDKWNKTPKQRLSFHHTLLITDEPLRNVSSSTRGWYFHWGSKVDGRIFKTGVQPQMKLFEADKEIDLGNKFEYQGETHWTNDQIQQLITMFCEGGYNLMLSNCRDVVADTALGLTMFATSSYNVSVEAIKEVSREVNKYRYDMNHARASAMEFLGTGFSQPVNESYSGNIGRVEARRGH